MTSTGGSGAEGEESGPAPSSFAEPGLRAWAWPVNVLVTKTLGLDQCLANISQLIVITKGAYQYFKQTTTGFFDFVNRRGRRGASNHSLL